MKISIRGVWNAKSVLFIVACLLVVHLYLFFPKNNTPLYAQEISMDIFVRFDAVLGSSTDKEHLGWIEATGVGFSLTRPDAARIIFDAVTIVKEIDISSPILTLACIQRKHFKAATIHFVENSGGVRRVFYEIVMNDVTLDSVSVDTNSFEVSLKEAYKLNASRVMWTVTPVKPDGSPGAEVMRCWDFVRNTRCY